MICVEDLSAQLVEELKIGDRHGVFGESINPSYGSTCLRDSPCAENVFSAGRFMNATLGRCHQDYDE